MTSQLLGADVDKGILFLNDNCLLTVLHKLCFKALVLCDGTATALEIEIRAHPCFITKAKASADIHRSRNSMHLTVY